MASMRRCGEAGEQGGFAYAGVVTRADLARVTAYLGDGVGALTSAEQAVALAEERFPPAASVAEIGRAEACIALGDVDGARRSLAQVDGSLLPEPERTFALAFAGLARARLGLAARDAEEAVGAAEDLLRHLAANRTAILVAEALVILARARVAQDRPDEAEGFLADAAERAARLGEPLPHWEALALTAEVLDRRGAGDEAADARRRARAIVERLAAGVDDEDLRRRFLARPDVVALGD
jgi:tetratricopeptide (TPR) repeat protein